MGITDSHGARDRGIPGGSLMGPPHSPRPQKSGHPIHRVPAVPDCDTRVPKALRGQGHPHPVGSGTGTPRAPRGHLSLSPGHSRGKLGCPSRPGIKSHPVPKAWEWCGESWGVPIPQFWNEGWKGVVILVQMDLGSPPPYNPGVWQLFLPHSDVLGDAGMPPMDVGTPKGSAPFRSSWNPG